MRRLDRRRAVHQRWRELVRVGADEAVIIFETLLRRPAVERPGLAFFPFGDKVPLADCGGHIAVLFQHLGDGARRFGHDAGIAFIACRRVGDGPHADRMFVAPRQQRGAARRTDRRIIILRVAQAALPQGIEGRRGDRTAIGARSTITHIVGQDQDNIGRALGRLGLPRPTRLRVRSDPPRELRRGHLRLWHHGLGKERCRQKSNSGARSGQRHPASPHPARRDVRAGHSIGLPHGQRLSLISFSMSGSGGKLSMPPDRGWD